MVFRGHSASELALAAHSYSPGAHKYTLSGPLKLIAFGQDMHSLYSTISPCHAVFLNTAMSVSGLLGPQRHNLQSLGHELITLGQWPCF